MVLLSFFEISSGLWSTKKLIRLGLHVSPRTLWIEVLLLRSIYFYFLLIGGKVSESVFLFHNQNSKWEFSLFTTKMRLQDFQSKYITIAQITKIHALPNFKFCTWFLSINHLLWKINLSMNNSNLSNNGLFIDN